MSYTWADPFFEWRRIQAIGFKECDLCPITYYVIEKLIAVEKGVMFIYDESAQFAGYAVRPAWEEGLF